ncbi:cysteine and glycine-rich 2 [Brachionus plicatilis]|uniref:Cysteine and glycine-rich 2 n=1 Tax=Brachionus plicatilis TaxID=10195 RepID=A0A3M7Q9J3_BRAPC|nr:cysteine and glycine-rich 2 [Brachionus plicatilis]
MSENSFENNSTFSESFDISNQAESFSLSSPSSQQCSDELQSSYSSANLNSPPDQISPHTESLPAMNSNVKTTVLEYKRLVGDSELSELLTRRQPKFTITAPKCAKCDKFVYKAEETRAANKTYHKLCFKCYNCNKLLEPNILTEHQGDLYCKNCYGKKFGPKGYGYGSGAGILSSESPSSNSLPQTPSSLKASFSTFSNDSVGTEPAGRNLPTTPNSVNGFHGSFKPNGNNLNSVSSAFKHEKRAGSALQFGGADKCARCQKAVYAAEKVVAANKFYHKMCFSCSACKKMLNSMNCCDNSEGEVFCKSCYGKFYGPKGVGFGIGAGTLSTN